jgi:predicted HicB family RNase H-like nuclease
MENLGNDRIVVRLPPELRQQIEAAASKDRRSLSNFVRVVLSDAVQDRAAPAPREHAA